MSLPPRTGAVIAYSGWWITGALLWAFERRSGYVRFHAAQACVVFGALGGAVAVLAALALLSLLVMPAAFALWAWSAGVLWGAGLLLWVAAMGAAATGRDWRIPVAARLADRMCRS